MQTLAEMLSELEHVSGIPVRLAVSQYQDAVGRGDGAEARAALRRFRDALRQTRAVVDDMDTEAARLMRPAPREGSGGTDK